MELSVNGQPPSTKRVLQVVEIRAENENRKAERSKTYVSISDFHFQCGDRPPGALLLGGNNLYPAQIRPQYFWYCYRAISVLVVLENCSKTTSNSQTTAV